MQLFSVEYSESVEYSTVSQNFAQIQNVFKNLGFHFQTIWREIEKKWERTRPPPKNPHFDQNRGNFFPVEYSEAVEYSTVPEIFWQIQNIVKMLRFFFQTIWAKIEKMRED